jgi:hypothetical protein
MLPWGCISNTCAAYGGEQVAAKCRPIPKAGKQVAAGCGPYLRELCSCGAAGGIRAQCIAASRWRRDVDPYVGALLIHVGPWDDSRFLI